MTQAITDLIINPETLTPEEASELLMFFFERMSGEGKIKLLKQASSIRRSEHENKIFLPPSENWEMYREEKRPNGDIKISGSNDHMSIRLDPNGLTAILENTEQGGENRRVLFLAEDIEDTLWLL